jgi:hypothetical protein
VSATLMEIEKQKSDMPVVTKITQTTKTDIKKR